MGGAHGPRGTVRDLPKHLSRPANAKAGSKKHSGDGRLNVNVGGSPGNGRGTVGRFHGIAQRGATVNVARGGETRFSLPTNVANHNFPNGINAPRGVTVTRTTSGGRTTFTVRAPR
jgi:hypothetical protein